MVTLWEATKTSSHSGIVALQAAFPPDALTEVKRKGDEGKAGSSADCDTGGNDH